MENVVSESVVLGWWVPIIGSVLTILMAVLTFVAKKFVSWLIEKAEMNDAEKEAMQYLLEGMTKAQEELVREAKKSSADGKLTKEEIKQAETMAFDYAKRAAMGKAKDVVISWSTRRASSLIKQLLSKLKNKKGTNNGNTTNTTNEPVEATS